MEGYGGRNSGAVDLKEVLSKTSQMQWKRQGHLWYVARDHHLPTTREECAYLRVNEFSVDTTITSSRTQRSSLHSSPSDCIFTHSDWNWVTEVPDMSATCCKVWSPTLAVTVVVVAA